MKFLADENIPRPLIAALREAGHDVRAVVEDMAGIEDGAVLAASVADGRVLITADRDFGERAIHRGEAAIGIVLIELHRLALTAYVDRAMAAIAIYADRIEGAILTIEPGRERLRPLPPPTTGD